MARSLQSSLAAAGDRVDITSLAVNAIAPELPASISQAVLQGVLNGDKAQVEAAEKALDIVSKPKFQMMALKLNVAQIKSEQKLAIKSEGFEIERSDKFFTKFGNKEIERMNALNAAIDSFEESLRTGKPAAFNFGRTGFARGAGEGGRLTDADIDRAGASKSLKRRFQRLWEELAEGKVPKADSLELLTLTKILRIKVSGRLRDKARRFSEANFNQTLGVTSAQVQKRILGQMPQLSKERFIKTINGRRILFEKEIGKPARPIKRFD